MALKVVFVCLCVFSVNARPEAAINAETKSPFNQSLVGSLWTHFTGLGNIYQSMSNHFSGFKVLSQPLVLAPPMPGNTATSTGTTVVTNLTKPTTAATTSKDVTTKAATTSKAATTPKAATTAAATTGAATTASATTGAATTSSATTAAATTTETPTTVKATTASTTTTSTTPNPQPKPCDLEIITKDIKAYPEIVVKYLKDLKDEFYVIAQETLSCFNPFAKENSDEHALTYSCDVSGIVRHVISVPFINLIFIFNLFWRNLKLVYDLRHCFFSI